MESSNSPTFLLEALAGFLAEKGVGSMTLATGSGRKELLARRTDLPSELESALSAGGFTLEVHALHATIRVTPESASWDCDDPRTSIEIAKLFSLGRKS